ncbi:MAG: serine/threonine-protein kinase [Planctomycetota bacterium]
MTPAAFKVLTGTLHPRVILLPAEAGAPYVLGRSLESSLILSGVQVGERHALLLSEPAGHRLIPASPETAVWVSGERLSGPRLLAPGDRIRIGNHTLLYQPAERAEGRSGRSCAACGEPLGPSSGQARPRALKLADEVICLRCVDARLHLDRQLASYRVLRKITNNDEEVTYLAVDTESLERVAVRILRAEKQAVAAVLRRFLVRALVGVALDHPNFIPVRGVQTAAGIPFVVVEHVERSTKLEVLARERSPVPVADCLYVTNQLAEVLRHARERELVVAKRKRSGVLIDPSGWVKVLAYDVTTALERRVAASEAFADLARRAGAEPGALRAADYSQDTDSQRLGQLASEFAEVYSVGRILLQLACGQPWNAGMIDRVKESLQAAQAEGSPQAGPLAGRPAGLVELIERVIVPTGPARIRTLGEYLAASKATFEKLEQEGALG